VDQRRIPVVGVTAEVLQADQRRRFRLGVVEPPPSLRVMPSAAAILDGGPWRLRVFGGPRAVVPGFDGLDCICKRLSQDALAKDPEHDPKHPTLEVLALAYHEEVY